VMPILRMRSSGVRATVGLHKQKPDARPGFRRTPPAIRVQGLVYGARYLRCSGAVCKRKGGAGLG
jgi:hypothetical protein